MENISVFAFDSYKQFLVDRLDNMPKKGRGQAQRLARYLGVHSTFVSLVLRRDSNFTIEQSLKVASFFSLVGSEKDFFILLVNFERAGDVDTRNYYKTQLQKLKTQSQDLSQRIDFKKTLSPADQALFYSEWYYAAIHILTSLEKYRDPSLIGPRLGLTDEHVLRVLEFLSETGLCIYEGGKYRPGISRTYVDRKSPLVSRHHANWRMKILEQLHTVHDDELVFTSPTTISKKDFTVFREKIAKLIEEFGVTVASSPDEVFACLNIDWVRIKGEVLD